jgi:hypothetical protein
MQSVLVFAYSVSATPTTANIDKPLQHLLDVLMGSGLIISAIGFVVGGSLTAVGANSGSYGLATRGKSMMGWAALAAALIAGATAIVNWFWGLGVLI